MSEEFAFGSPFMASKKQRDLEKADKSIEYLKRYSSQQILGIISNAGFTKMPLHIRKAYKSILKERGIDNKNI